MILNEHKEMCPLSGWRIFGCYGNRLIWRKLGIHADRVWPGPEKLWIAGLTALVIHLHFKHVHIYLSGCDSV